MQKLLIALFLFSLYSCSDSGKKNSAREATADSLVKFDKLKWAEKKGDDYPYRDAMLKDLMSSYEWHGVKSDSLLKELGEPDRTDSLYFFYNIRRKSMAGFTLSLKALVINLNPDSTVKWLKIHE